jgi:hypothetical protein
LASGIVIHGCGRPKQTTGESFLVLPSGDRGSPCPGLNIVPVLAPVRGTS